MPETARERVIVYIDGFNLYFGLRQSGYRRFYWLDVAKLARSFLRGPQLLVRTKFFTARISDRSGADGASRKRQATYLDALSTLQDLDIYEGTFLLKRVRCAHCAAVTEVPEEKKTDVNIATQLLVDAFHNAFGCAIVVSGDSDLTPPVEAILKRFPDKRVVIALPPGRRSKQLVQAATGSFHIGRAALSRSQLPRVVKLANGFSLQRPHHWR